MLASTTSVAHCLNSSALPGRRFFSMDSRGALPEASAGRFRAVPSAAVAEAAAEEAAAAEGAEEPPPPAPLPCPEAAAAARAAELPPP